MDALPDELGDDGAKVFGAGREPAEAAAFVCAVGAAAGADIIESAWRGGDAVGVDADGAAFRSSASVASMVSPGRMRQHFSGFMFRSLGEFFANLRNHLRGEAVLTHPDQGA